MEAEIAECSVSVVRRDGRGSQPRVETVGTHVTTDRANDVDSVSKNRA